MRNQYGNRSWLATLRGPAAGVVSGVVAGGVAVLALVFWFYQLRDRAPLTMAAPLKSHVVNATGAAVVGAAAAGAKTGQPIPPTNVRAEVAPEIRKDAILSVVNGGLMIRQRVLEQLSASDVPVLHRLLKDASVARQWPRIACLIGWLSQDPQSVSELEEYIRRDDRPFMNDADFVAGKISALRSIGLIAGPEASAVLRRALTHDGAMELAKEWLYKGLPAPWDREPTMILADIQTRAALGLVLTQKPENTEPIERMYEVALEVVRSRASAKVDRTVDTVPYEVTMNRHILDGMVDALVARDFIAVQGLDRYLELSDLGERMEALAPYRDKYRLD